LYAGSWTPELARMALQDAPSSRPVPHGERLQRSGRRIDQLTE
jgi:hypothetical protein